MDNKNSTGKLYAVTAGTYSDYHIVTICSDKERAEQIRDIYNGGHSCFGDAKVEEYDDGIRVDISRPLFQILLDKDGKFEKASECDGERKIDVSLDPDYAWMLNIAEQRLGGFSIHVFADNVDLAIKIARDKLAQYKAEHEGVI